MKLIHLTDLHLVPPGERLFTLDPAERLRCTFSQINHDHGDAELCVVTGDLADKGAPEAYGLLRELLQELQVPWRLLLGNHDRRTEFVAAFPDLARDTGGFLQSVHDSPAGRLIFLDTLVEGRGHGALDGGRRDWLAARLQEVRNSSVLVFSHHPLQPIGLRHFEPIGLIDSGPVMDLLAAHGLVRHIFSGHVHVDASGSWRGIPFSASRGIAHQIAPHLTRADADFVRNAPAFDVAIIDEASVLVHRFEVEAGREIIAVSPAIALRLETTA